MGIPKFLRWIKARYPLIVSTPQHEIDILSVDNLYIDLNSSLHLLASNSEELGKLWEALFQYIDGLVNLVRPEKVLFIALDGVPPIAKIQHQRSRRVVQNSKKELFDANAISPGTEFMQKVNKKVDDFISEKMKASPLYSKLRIIFSDSNVPGEGEQKIIQHIRASSNSTRHCIFGMDSDLIILALTSHNPLIYILRDTMDKTTSRPLPIKVDELEIIYTSVLRDYLEVEYKDDVEPKLSFEFDLDRLIDDFVFLTLFVGNDFIPYSYIIDIHFGELDYLIKKYKEILPELSTYIVNKDHINWDSVRKLLHKLEKYETVKVKERYSSPENYYKEKFGPDIEKTEVKRIIQAYVEGLEWMQYYYYIGVKHWRWFYPYYYTPLISSLLEYLSGTIQITIAKNHAENTPISPFQQLLAILPKNSKSLLPPPYHHLYEATEIAELHPEKYKIDLNGRVLPWEAVKLIPFVDFNKVVEIESNSVSTGLLKNEEKARNMVHCVLYYIGPKGKEDLSQPNEGFIRKFPTLKNLDVVGCNLVPIGKSCEGVELLIEPHCEVITDKHFVMPVYIGYPSTHEALVVFIVTKTCEIISLSEDRKNLVKKPAKNVESYFGRAKKVMKEARLAPISEFESVYCCIELESITIKEGKIEKHYSESKKIVPGPLVMFKVKIKH